MARDILITVTVRTYKYRLYPTKAQEKILEKNLFLCRNLYNCALQERRSHYRKYNDGITYTRQAGYLPGIKEDNPEYKEVYSQVLQSTLKRLDGAFKNFFRRMQQGEKPGFPRFKGKDRFHSILYPQHGFTIGKTKGLKGNKRTKIYLSKIGYVKMVHHLNIKGNPKTCQVIRSPYGKWHVCITCDKVPKEPLDKTGKETGIDLGISKFIVKKDGNGVPNPKHFKKSQDKLAAAQRRVAKLGWATPAQRKKRKAEKTALARKYEKVKNQRDDFYHKLSKSLIKDFDFIAIEKLDIKGMKSFKVLNREIQNVAWDKFVQMLLYKAESADKVVVQVDPRNTTQMCSGCGEIVKKDLSMRIHHCDGCGLMMDRDHNAAINIYNRGKETLPRESGDSFSELSRSSRL